MNRFRQNALFPSITALIQTPAFYNMTPNEQNDAVKRERNRRIEIEAIHRRQAGRRGHMVPHERQLFSLRDSSGRPRRERTPQNTVAEAKLARYHAMNARNTNRLRDMGIVSLLHNPNTMGMEIDYDPNVHRHNIVRRVGSKWLRLHRPNTELVNKAKHELNRLKQQKAERVMKERGLWNLFPVGVRNALVKHGNMR